MSTVLEVQGLSKAYAGTPAVRELSLQIAAGEFVALLGPNGAGKSTLFQMLTGLFAPDAGEIHVCGAPLRGGLPRALARIGVVFQQPTLDLELSVAGNLRFHARLHGLGRCAPRIAAALAAVGLAEDAGRPCRALSGGNRRKVELARALLHEPALLLMDEATVGLDPRSRRELLEQVQGQCRERGMAVLWATHLVSEATQADRVMVLHQGRCIAEGSPAAVAAAAEEADLETAFLKLTRRDGDPRP